MQPQFHSNSSSHISFSINNKNLKNTFVRRWVYFVTFQNDILVFIKRYEYSNYLVSNYPAFHINEISQALRRTPRSDLIFESFFDLLSNSESHVVVSVFNPLATTIDVNQSVDINFDYINSLMSINCFKFLFIYFFAHSF